MKSGGFGCLEFFYLVTLATYSLAACPVQSDNKLFGANCDLKCHCKDNVQCNFNTGACATGCDDGWVGPGCQYANLAYNKPSQQKSTLEGGEGDSHLAVDGDVGTCSNTLVSSDNWWRVDLGTKHTVVGLTVRLKKDSSGNVYRNNLVIYVTNNTDDTGEHPVCYQETGRKAASDVILDVTCTKPLIGQFLEIHIPEMSDLQLCDVEVYGGRELAFMKTTNQSSRFTPAHNSSVAVDGVTVDNTTHSSCIQTRRSRDPWWSVNLEQLFIVQSVVIYNRQDPGKQVLNEGFLLEIDSQPRFDSSHRYTYRHTQPTAEPVIRVDLALSVLGQYVRVTLPGNDRILTFCELEVFGDCPDGKCGYGCQFTCLCNTTTTGHRKINNTCPYGCAGRATGLFGRCDFVCADNKWGEECSEMCGTCVNGEPCDVINGTCLSGCSLGFKQTPSCQDGCETGLYGKTCELTCGHCADKEPCYGLYGTCRTRCEPGYRFPQCQTVCNTYTWGINCNMTCGKCHNGEPCDHVTGVCLEGCGFRIQETPRCDQGCEPNFYGSDCRRCGRCAERSCDTKTGSCIQCQHGYQLPLCQKECMTGQYGTNCMYTCGHCKDGVACDHVTGDCPNGCFKHWKGSLCNIGTVARSLFGPPGQDHGTMAVVGMVLGGAGAFVCMTVMLVGLVIFCWRRRRKRHEDEMKYKSYMVRNQLGVDNQSDDTFNYTQTTF